jgi:PAS domain S-box-containing protein
MNVKEENITLFKTIFEQTPISTQIFTPDGKTIMVNKAWEDLWNAKFEQLENYNILQDSQLVESGSMPYILRGFKGEHVTIPAIYYDPSKTVPIEGLTPRWLSARMYPIRDANQNITYLVLQHEDITDRKLSEENLKESQERLRATWESATDAMALSDSEGIIIDANSAYLKLYGYSREEVVGKNFSIIFPKKFQKWANEQYQKTFNAKKNSSVVEAEIVSKDGTKHIVESRYSFIVKNQRRVAMLSVVRDITEHKQSEFALRESEERLRISLDAGKIGVWDWDIKNNRLKWTDNVYAIHGVTKENFNVSFQAFQELIHQDDKDHVVTSVSECLKTGSPLTIDFRVIGHDKKLRWVTTSATLLFDSEKKPVRMLGATSEITHQKQLEQDKSDFLSMASHELKTPITSMKMFVDLLLRELSESTMKKPLYFATRIKDQTNRLTELTNDLLDVSRIETGKLKLNVEKFNLNDLIRETVESIQASTSHKLIIRKNEVIYVPADKYRIYQVLVNLITNAIKYSPDNKQIIISTKMKNDEVIISVKDHGIGIEKEKQNKIFERLYQVTDQKERTFPGLGLGLFISKEIVERHKGNLWVKSEKGKGATFYFSLPMSVNT